MIALVEMGDGSEFFIDNAPSGKIESWIGDYVYDIGQVEFVEVIEVKGSVQFWSNPDCCSE
jgi:hypothetical protein